MVSTLPSAVSMMLNLALPLKAAGVTIIGTSPESIDLAEDRKRFGKLLSDLKIPQPPSGTASSYQEAAAIAQDIGFPVLVRPSYVLGVEPWLLPTITGLSKTTCMRLSMFRKIGRY